MVSWSGYAGKNGVPMRKILSCVAVTICSAALALAARNDAPVRGAKAVAALKRQGAYDGFNAAYTAAIYAVEPDRDGGYQAWNARQRLTARFDTEGVKVEGAHGDIGLRLAGWGYGTTLTPAKAPVVSASGKRIEYRRSGLVEWYVNETDGIEQGFTLAEPPAPGRPGAPLAIALAMRGPLLPELEDEGRSILLRSGGTPELRYAGLRAWDARGRDLPARMEITGDEIRILVDDANAAYPVTIDPAVQQAELTAPDGAGGDGFGLPISLSKNTVAAGAAGKNGHTGAAYVFVRSGTTWSLQAELTASDGAVNDFFGYSVSVSGNTVVVGAIGNNNSTGAAYVFVRSGIAWTQQAELAASDGFRYDVFGASVSVNGDTMVAGAPDRNIATGAAYVFVRSGSAWTQQAELTASDGAPVDMLGTSVSVSGNTLVAGALKNSVGGAAYVFVRSGTVWSQQAELVASDGASGNNFGQSVCVSGSTIVSGAPGRINFTGAAYVFVGRGGSWTQEAELTASHGVAGDNFGTAVSIHRDSMVVGALGRNNNTGAAYLFTRSNTVWTQHPKLIASDGVSGDEFGRSVSISGDTIVAGAPGKNGGAGAAYVYVVGP